MSLSLFVLMSGASLLLLGAFSSLQSPRFVRIHRTKKNHDNRN